MIQFLTSILETVAKLDAPPPIPVRSRRSDLFADVPVIDQFGKTHRFRTDLVRGKAVIINTMFTVCRGSCPGTSETLERVRQTMQKTFGGRVTFISLTIDPTQDSQQAMLEYAGRYGAAKPAAENTPPWLFLTGTPENVETLRRSLGFYDLNKKIDSDITRHASLLLFGNDHTDRWATSPAGLRDGLLIEPLRRILGETTEERFGIRIPSHA